MNAELFAGFEKESSGLKATIASQRAELEHIEDGEESAIARHKISALESLVSTVTKARDTIALAERDAEESPKQFRRWREAVAKARDAKIALDGFAKSIEETQIQIDQAEHSFQVAVDALTDHRNHPIENPDYAAQATIRRWETRCAQLQATVNEKSATLRALKEKIAGLRGGWIRAAQVFDASALTERVTRLPRPEKPEGIGTLSSVS